MSEKDKKTNKDSRREFLKKAAIGAIGTSALIAGLGGSEKAFARLLSRKTNLHIDEFFARVRGAALSREADANLSETIQNLVDLATNDAGVVRSCNTLLEHFAQRLSPPGREPVTGLGLSKSVSDLLVGGYLASLSAMRSAPLSSRELSGFLGDVGGALERLEPDFLTRAMPQLQAEISGNSDLGNLVRSGEENMISNLRMAEPPIEIGATFEVPTWVAIVAVVVIIVLIIVLK